MNEEEITVKILEDGTKEYYRNGLLHRDNDLPAVECAHGTKFWFKNGKLHRDNNLPAMEYYDGDKEWYKDGQPHREDGPAQDFIKVGLKRYWYNGKQLDITTDAELRLLIKTNFMVL